MPSSTRRRYKAASHKSSRHSQHPGQRRGPGKSRLWLEYLEDRTLLDSGALPHFPDPLSPRVPEAEKGAGWLNHEYIESLLDPTQMPPATDSTPSITYGPSPAGNSALVNDPSVDLSAQNTQSETTLVVFGSGPTTTIVAAYNDSGSFDIGSDRFTGFSRSTDNGNSFVDMGALPINPLGDAGDPVLARDNVSGTIYLSTLQFSGSGISVFRSFDGGETFAAPVDGTPGAFGFQDKEWLTVDNFAGAGQGNIYLAVRDFGGGSGIFLYSSTDGGETFGPSGGTFVASSCCGWDFNVQGAWVTVGSDHSVYVFWFDETSFPERIMMRKSTDFGVSFDAPVEVATLSTGFGFNGNLGLSFSNTDSSSFRTNAFPQAVVNPATGDLYVTFSDNPAGSDKADVFFTQSSDGGSSWSAPLRLNDDATTNDQWFPALAVSPDGTRVGVAWYDRRLDSNNGLIDRYGIIGKVSGSTVTFDPNFRITDNSFPAVACQDPVVNCTYMGDYDQAAVALDNSYFYTIWSDNSLGNPDVRFAKIPLGLVVTGSTPGAGDVVSTAPVDFGIDFSDAYDPATVEAGDLTVNGIAADSFTLTDADTITFHFTVSPVTSQGLQSLALAADSINRLADGDGVGAFSADFRYDVLLLQVSSTLPADGSVVLLPMTTLDLNFNEAYDPASAEAGDFTVNQGSLTSVSQIDADTLQLTLSGVVAEGILNVYMAAGAMTDVFGNPGASYSGTFILDFDTVPYPTPLAGKPPAGSLIYDPTQPGFIGYPGDTDTYTLLVDPGQKLTVLVDPDTGLQPSIDLYRLDPSGPVLMGSASAAGAGLDALIQSAYTHGQFGVSGAEAKTYQVTVSGVNGTTGGYTLQIVLNAALETESHDGPTNNNRDTAQSLEPASLQLVDDQPQIMSVLGSTDAGQLMADSPDYYSFNLKSGESATLVLTSLSGGEVSLEVRNCCDPLALGAGPAGNTTAVVKDFYALSTGTYYAYVTGAAGVDYSLTITRNAGLDRESNNDIAHAQDLLARRVSGYQWVAGHLTGVDPTAGGIPLTLDAINSGWWTDSGFHFDFNDNYIAGRSSGDRRDFFVFDLSQVNLPVLNAELRLFNPVGGFSSPDPTESFSVYDVSTPISELQASGFGRTDIFEDLGTGAEFGTQTVSAADDGQVVSINLNDAALAYLNSRQGGLAALGGAITTLSGFADQFVFGFTFGGFSRQLVLTLGDPSDFYRITLAEGKTFELTTYTPADGSGEFVNNLDPAIRLLNSTGGLVKEDDNSGTDGRNAKLTYRVPVGGGGTYFVEVRTSPLTAVPTSGEYILSVKNATGALPPFQAAAINPAGGSRIRGPLSQITVDFNDAILLSTVRAADLTVNGIPATDVAIVDADTLVFTVAGLGEGVQNVAIAAGAIRDIQHTPIAAFTSQSYHDITPPRVVASSIQAGDTLPAGSLIYTAQFSEEMDATTLDAFDVVLTGSTYGNYSPDSISYDSGTNTLTVAYSNLPEDSYTIILLSGDFGLQDIVGWDLDGEPLAFPIPPNISGDGVEGGDFQVHFVIDIGILPFPVPLDAKPPLGSMIYDPSVTAFIQPPGDTDSLTIDVEAGQTITVLVKPAPAQATLYGGVGAGSFNSGSLLSVNQDSGTGSFIGDPVTPGGLTGLAYDPATDTLLGSTIRTAGSPVSTLVRIDTTTGALLAVIGNITDGVGGPVISIGDLAIEPGAGTLYGIRSNADGQGLGGLLYTIDTSTGVASLVGDTFTGVGGGIAFGPDGKLYQIVYGALLELDPANASVLATVFLSTGIYFDSLGSRPTDGMLFASPGGGFNDIYTIEPLTGIVTFVGYTFQGSPSDLAFGPIIPALAPSVELRDSSSALVGSASSPTGSEAVIQTVATTSTGVYTVIVSGTGGSTGQYTLQIILNAAVENESHGGSANDDLASAQNIEASFINLLKGADRGAVLGSLEGNDYYAFDLAAGQSVSLGFATAVPIGSFGGRADYLSGSNPTAVAYGDLNNDGYADMVSANLYGFDAGVRLNNGDGSFGPSTRVGYYSNYPYDVALGDVNNDGNLDILLSNFDGNYFGGSIRAMLGNGDGTFGTPIESYISYNATGVALADFNGDGNLDVAQLDYYGWTVNLGFGDGTGSFLWGGSFFAGASPWRVAAGDINGDLVPDLAVSNVDGSFYGHGNVAILINDGFGGFGAATGYLTSFDYTYGIALADLDGDADLDVANTNYYSWTASVLLNDGVGNLGGPSHFSTGTNSYPVSVAAGDVNGDGILDLATANNGAAGASVLLGTGVGSFGAPEILAAPFVPTDVAIEDLNNDGLADLSTANYFDSTVSVWLAQKVTLELLDSTGAVLATGVAGPENLELIINDFVAPSAGTYYVRIVGSGISGVPYTLIATRDAVFQLEPNDSLATAQSLGNTHVALGHIGGGVYAASAVPFEFEDISATGTRVMLGCDDCSYYLDPVSLNGFSFSFFGTTYSDVYFSSNGLITFGSGVSAYSNGDLTTFPGEAAIAPHWDDMYISGSPDSSVIWEVRGTGLSQRLIIQWNQVNPCCASDQNTVTFQAVLGRDGSIQFNYLDLDSPYSFFAEGGSATVGIKAAGDQGDDRLLLSFNSGPNSFVGTGLSTRIVAVDIDNYSFTAAEGETIHLFTATPGDGPGEFTNYLDPHIRLFDPNGLLVATGVALADGHNEEIIFTVPAGGAGTYIVEVSAEGGTIGEYILDPSPLVLPARGQAENPPTASLAPAISIQSHAAATAPGSAAHLVLLDSLDGRTALVRPATVAVARFTERPIAQATDGPIVSERASSWTAFNAVRDDDGLSDDNSASRLLGEEYYELWQSQFESDTIPLGQIEMSEGVGNLPGATDAQAMDAIFTELAGTDVAVDLILAGTPTLPADQLGGPTGNSLGSAWALAATLVGTGMLPALHRQERKPFVLGRSRRRI